MTNIRIKDLLKLVYLISFMLLFSSCKTALLSSAEEVQLSDPDASLRAKYLLLRIKEVAKSGYAFGHQDATAYGLGWKNDGNQYRSDVNDVAGDFPGVYGFELGHLELGHEQNLDSVNFDLMRRLIQDAHSKGGIITISWHPNNPVSGESAWDEETIVLPYILKGGLLYPKYRAWLSKVADFLNSLETKKGRKIPVVFRPYHEMTGPWFWWGKDSATPEQYKQLWQETFDILTKEYNVHNAVFCYSTDVVEHREEYLRNYPGDAYVDMLGIDLYHKKTTEHYIELLNHNLDILKQVGLDKKMPYALTEGGLETIPIENWWTEVFDKNISNKGIAWALVWRNAWPNHYYAPFIGQKSSANFKRFKELPHVLFLDDLKQIK